VKAWPLRIYEALGWSKGFSQHDSYNFRTLHPPLPLPLLQESYPPGSGHDAERGSPGIKQGATRLNGRFGT